VLKLKAKQNILINLHNQAWSALDRRAIHINLIRKYKKKS